MKNLFSTRSFSFGMGTFLFPYLVLSLFILSVSGNDNFFLSIDCGSSDSYEDENSIAWTGDAKYIKTGESHSVQSPKYSISRVMDTMRVFTFPKKNCYHIDSVKQGQRVLVRASFLYGNYDNKSSPPIFNLYIEGSYWKTIRPLYSSVVYYELIYVLKKDSISVCVSPQKIYPDMVPFISALEVRGLPLSMYQYQYPKNVDNNPLFMWSRLAFGSNQTIRYPSDPYDRIWSNEDINYISLVTVSNTANLSNLVRVGEEPPAAALKHAVTAALPNASIVIPVGIYFPVEAPAYFTAYFSEVAQLKPNEKRSFRIYLDIEPISEPILPPYGDYIERSGENITFKILSNLVIVPTHDSTLPPLINALEIFYTGGVLNSSTDSRDVAGLASLQKAFPVLQKWTGDPCLPFLHEWEWIGCSSDYYSPRVIELHLRDYGLSGLIPDFSSMDALYSVDLQNNSLKGPIPDFFARLPNLKILDLRDNQLNGTVPASLSTKLGRSLLVSGNPELCDPGMPCRVSCSRKMNKNVMAIFFGSIIPIIITSYTLF